MNIIAIVFDFDGVITPRGEALKEEAWERLIANPAPEEGGDPEVFPRLLREAREKYGQGKARGSRYDILREALRGAFLYAGVELDGRIEFYACEYNRHVQEMVLEDGLLTGTKETLEDLASDFSLYVNSATPRDAVRGSVERLGLAHVFDDVLGMPGTKVENLKEIAKRELVRDPEHILFVGDSSGDEKAAQEFGCRFVGVANDRNCWEGKPYPLVRHLREIRALLEEVHA